MPKIRVEARLHKKVWTYKVLEGDLQEGFFDPTLLLHRDTPIYRLGGEMIDKLARSGVPFSKVEIHFYLDSGGPFEVSVAYCRPPKTEGVKSRFERIPNENS
jgi:hypothetical protein